MANAQAALRVASTAPTTSAMPKKQPDFLVAGAEAAQAGLAARLEVQVQFGVVAVVGMR